MRLGGDSRQYYTKERSAAPLLVRCTFPYRQAKGRLLVRSLIVLLYFLLLSINCITLHYRYLQNNCIVNMLRLLRVLGVYRQLYPFGGSYFPITFNLCARKTSITFKIGRLATCYLTTAVHVCDNKEVAPAPVRRPGWHLSDMEQERPRRAVPSLERHPSASIQISPPEVNLLFYLQWRSEKVSRSLAPCTHARHTSPTSQKDKRRSEYNSSCFQRID